MRTMTSFLVVMALGAPWGGRALAAGPTATGAQGAGAEVAGAAPAAGGDESIYVVQRRNFSKRGSLDLTPALFASLNNKFSGYLGLGLSGAYHLRENFAVELTTSFPYLLYAFYSDLVYDVREFKLQPEAANMKQVRYFATLSVQYSALYGKLDLNDNLIDYDVYVSTGAGVVSTVEACIPGKDSDCGDPIAGIDYGQRTPHNAGDALKVAGNLGLGMRIFFSKSLGLNLEVRDLVYPDRAGLGDPPDTSTDIRNNVLLFLGMSVLL
jgi:outer membrane beta-barrel protein